MTASAKGATVRGTLSYIERLAGRDGVERVLAGLSPADADALRDVQPIDDVPYERVVSLWDAADQQLRATHPDWAERAGGFSIESLGVQLYGGILRKPTPTDFLTQSVSLFRLFYSPGDMTVVQEEPATAVLRLVGFDPRTSVFCRRQVGGLGRALELAGGDAPHVRHVRCALLGDAFCEWEMRWTDRDARSESRS